MDKTVTGKHEATRGAGIANDNLTDETIHDPQSVTLPEQRGWSKRPGASIIMLMGKLHVTTQRIPLAYKLSFFITVLVVGCMVLLGVILIQQQTRVLQQQIDEQGTTLAGLMGQSTREPLLANDKPALDSITASFTNGKSVLASAVISQQGEVIAQAGTAHTGNTALLGQITRGNVSSYRWNWKPASGKPHQVISFVQPVSFRGITAGYSLVTFSQSGMKESVRLSVQAITAATLLVIALGIGMAFALGQHITLPINELVDASRAMEKGEYSFKFSEHRHDELGLLMNAFNDMAAGMLEKSQVKNALSRYVSPGVARQILSNLNTVELGSKKIEATVLFADIAGFTEIAEKTDPEALVNMLNEYFSLITCACEINFGTVDKYMGDGVMLVFGAPEPDKNHVFNAIVCALLAQKLITHESEQRKLRGEFPVKFKIGMNSGSMLAGNMGSKKRMEYTVVGDTVNMASRLCSITNGGQIVMSRDMYNYEGIKERIVAGEYQSIQLRGVSEYISTYLLEALTADYQAIVDEQFEQALEIMGQTFENA